MMSQTVAAWLKAHMLHNHPKMRGKARTELKNKLQRQALHAIKAKLDGALCVICKLNPVWAQLAATGVSRMCCDCVNDGEEPESESFEFEQCNF